MKDGGPAFPRTRNKHEKAHSQSGMTLRDWFAGSLQADDRLVKCIRAMDDTALAMFALYPDSEREDWITEVENAADYLGLDTQIQKIIKRLMMEAQAIARVRYMQADAMVAHREAS